MATEQFQSGNTRFEYDEGLTGDVVVVTPNVTVKVPLDDLMGFAKEVRALLRESRDRRQKWRDAFSG